MNKHRILIVDDEHAITRMVKLNLESTGRYEVRGENSSVNALAVAREFRPDLVLLDVIMPGADGGEIAARMKMTPSCGRCPSCSSPPPCRPRRRAKAG